MAKYTIVKERPATLEKDEYLIDTPSFLDEVRENSRKAGRGGITGANHLRGIVDSIAQKYDPQNMSGFSIRPHLFEGREYKTDEDLNAIVVDMLQKEYPAVFPCYVEVKTRARPKGTNLVYLVDFNIPGAEQILQNNGLDLLEEEKKPKKVVGKPAVKDKDKTADQDTDQDNNDKK